ncbi:hypothetical protein AB0F73_18425 [Micromonospora purpureochromogenes]|uniref:hypothetical protein n=1 Tax=Micromonospora purpureochromogenes TaxID=47872 RepID=UPI0033C1FF0A
MLTLIDIGSRDAFSLALLDTAEDRQPHALLAVTCGAVLTLHGPIAGRAAAADYAPHLALHDPDVAATTPVTLHHPDQPRIGCNEWLTVPPNIASAARTTAPTTGSVALVLLDRDRAQLAVVGPFAGENGAQAWQADADGGRRSTASSSPCARPPRTTPDRHAPHRRRRAARRPPSTRRRTSWLPTGQPRRPVGCAAPAAQPTMRLVTDLCLWMIVKALTSGR